MKDMVLKNCQALESAIEGVSFFRCRMNAGETSCPALDAEHITVFLFNGNSAFIQTKDSVMPFAEPAVFIPNFAQEAYEIHAVQDIEFLMCVFTMNAWDKEFFKGWNLHLPYFSVYTDGVRFRYAGRSQSLGSWSLIQPFQLGHLSLSFINGKGGTIKSSGNALQNEWIYPVGGSKFSLSINDGKAVPVSSDSFCFIPANSPYVIEANGSDAIRFFHIEYFVDDDLQKYYLAQIFNGRMTEAI